MRTAAAFDYTVSSASVNDNGRHQDALRRVTRSGFVLAGCVAAAILPLWEPSRCYAAAGVMMTDEEKRKYERLYNDCSNGPFHPFRDHGTQFGWGIRHAPTGRIFGYIGAKGCCFGVAAALNGHWEAAQVFMDESLKIDNDYFTRFTR